MQINYVFFAQGLTLHLLIAGALVWWAIRRLSPLYLGEKVLIGLCILIPWLGYLALIAYLTVFSQKTKPRAP